MAEKYSVTPTNKIKKSMRAKFVNESANKQEEIDDLKQKIMYARSFHPEKVDIYLERLKELEGELPKNTIDEAAGFMLNDDLWNLWEGFSESDFENFVYANESDIKENMKRYGFTEANITSIRNPYDFANVLGCDSRAVHDVELRYWTRVLKELLFEKSEEF